MLLLICASILSGSTGISVDPVISVNINKASHLVEDTELNSRVTFSRQKHSFHRYHFLIFVNIPLSLHCKAPKSVGSPGVQSNIFRGLDDFCPKEGERTSTSTRLGD